MEKNTYAEVRYYSTATICKMLDVSRAWLEHDATTRTTTIDPFERIEQPKKTQVRKTQ